MVFMEMKKVLVLLIVIILLGAGYFFLFAKKGTAPTTQTAPVTQTQQTQQTVSPPASQAAQNTVTLTVNGFSPATLTISAGQTVTWVNQSGEMATINSDPHPTHTNYTPLNLGGFASGASLSLSFPTAGTYGYHNHLNPSERGTIIVK